MKPIVVRSAVVVGIALVAVVGLADAAGAKIIPVQAVVVTPTRTVVGQRIAVEMRVSARGDIGDYAWENYEVMVVPAARTDASGWPFDPNEQGQPVALRRAAPRIYRGTFTETRPGTYIVVNRSSFYARHDPTPKPYVAPVRIRVGPIAMTARASHSQGSSSTSWLAIIAVAFGALTVAVTAVVLARRKHHAPNATPTIGASA